MGKYAGSHTGRVSVREGGDFDIQIVLGTERTKIAPSYRQFTMIQLSGEPRQRDPYADLSQAALVRAAILNKVGQV